MPSTSKKQHNFMAAIANNPAFSKKVGIPQSVGKDFTAADKGRKFRTGGRPAINKQDTQHGSMDMPFKSVRKFAGMKSGGKVKKYAGDTDDGSEVNADTSGDSDYQKYSETKPIEMAPAAAQPSAAKPKIITKEQLGGMSLRDYMNNMQRKTRRGGSGDAIGNEAKLVTTASNPSKVAAAMQSAPMSNGPDNTSAVTGRTMAPRKMSMEPATSTARPDTGYRRMSDRDRAIFDIQQQAPTQFNQNKKTGGSIKGMKKGGLARGGMAAPMMASGGKMKYNFEKSGKDVEKKGMKEGSKADMALDKKQMMKGDKPAFMMKKGGMAGYAKGGGIESKGKTKGTVIRMASGGSVSSASRRADGIAQRGKTRC